MDEEVERHRETVFESIGNCSVYLSRQWETRLVHVCVSLCMCQCVSGGGGGECVCTYI